MSVLVSVSCITYNHAPYIRECLDGFLMQKTNFPIEVVIHDDCSTDGTKEIIQEYAEKYPDIFFPIFQSENQYSKGIRGFNVRFNFPRCRGKYIALCEGDDYWVDPLKLQKQFDFLETNNEYVLCSHDAKITDSSGKLIKESKLPNFYKKDATSDELKKGFWVLTLGMMFRNLPILTNYPKEGFCVLNGDIFLISILGGYGRSKYMDTIEPAIYREHSGGVWSLTSKRFKKINNFNTFFYIAKYYERIGDKIAKEIYLSSYINGFWLFVSGFKNCLNFSSQLKILKFTLVAFIKIKSLKYILEGIEKTFFLLLKKIASFTISKIKHN